MKIARYWARATLDGVSGEHGTFDLAVRRGSNRSPEHALRLAKQAVEDLAKRVRAGEDLDWYDYAEAGKPEPIVHEWGRNLWEENEQTLAAVTINRYGCKVLNTRSLVFIDVDFGDDAAPTVGGVFGRLFGKKNKLENKVDLALAKLELWVAEGSGRGARAYRTAAGLRYLLVNPPMAPDSDEALDLMDDLGADDLYSDLCMYQQCFRARLTPKPWRMGVGRPPFPIGVDEQGKVAPAQEWRRTDADLAALQRWMERYELESQRYGVCAPVAEYGDLTPSSELDQELIDLHDAETRAFEGLALA